MASNFYSLPELPFSTNALVPYISEQIMELHFYKHHQAYVTNLNAATKAHSEALATNDLVTQIELQATIRFNARGHINHTLFWENLTPPTPASSPQSDNPKLHEAIVRKWQDFEAFKKAFEAVTLSMQGSGWIWLTKDVGGDQLEIAIKKDQDIVAKGKSPLLGVDMWEHAYYLQYLNNKKEYITGIWKVVNWQTAEKRFVGGPRETFGNLKGLTSKM